MAAYVTSRMVPSTAAVHHGAWFQTNGEEAGMNKFGLGMPDPSLARLASRLIEQPF